MVSGAGLEMKAESYWRDKDPGVQPGFSFRVAPEVRD